MKLVINKCFGGFGLSPEATKEYLKLKGKKCFFYEQTKYEHDGGIEEYTRIDKPNNDHSLVFTYTKDFGKTINKFPTEDKHYFYDRDIKRDDKDLLKVVKKLGKKANDRFSKLQIVEIPDNTKYNIEEYDGQEWVAEQHQTWG